MKISKSFLDQFLHLLETSGAGGWRQWLPILAVLLTWLSLIFLLVYCLRHINYRIGPRHMKVTLFGIPIRRVRLDNIRMIHTRRTRFAEKWHNVILPRPDRTLVIEKKRGLFKRFVVTPEQRYVFKSELDKAIRAHLGLKPGPTVADITTFDRMKITPAAMGENAVSPASASEQPFPAEQA